MSNWRVLVADDNTHVIELLDLYGKREEVEVLGVTDGSGVMPAIQQERPDLLVLDLMLPGKDGLSICRELRSTGMTSDLPIIMLTAKGEEADRILGLEMGADDYVAKPFSPREMIARIKAVLRRSQPSQESGLSVLRYGTLEIDPFSRAVSCGGVEINLRPREFDLLLFLAQNAGQVFRRDHLLERVWGYEYYGDVRTVDAHVKNLRQKLSSGCGPHIRTVWGVGYAFSPGVAKGQEAEE